MKTRKVFYGLIAFVLLGGLAAIFLARPSAAQPSDPVEVLRQQTDGKVRVSYHAETGKVRFMGTDLTHPMPQPLALQAGATAEDAARQFLGAYGSVFGLSDQAQELTLERSKTLDDGRSVVRFQQAYQGIPVVGGELVVQMNPDMQVLSVNGEALPDLNLDVIPSLDSDQARQSAIEKVTRTYEVSADNLSATTPELWIFNQAILGGPGPQISLLVWRMEVTPNELLPISELVLVEAHTGAVVLSFNQIDTVLNRTVYDNQNVRSNDLSLNPAVCTEGSCPGSGADSNFAYDFAGDTYNFYWDFHSRDSINAAGMPILSTVRYCPLLGYGDCPYPNAFWNGEQMVYGESYASADDVVGHEMTHGVTDNESRLFYYYQSGAINESLSDVWGEFIDQDNTYDGIGGSVRWQMGEDLSIGAIRSMSDPTSFFDPDRIGSPYYYCADSHGWSNDNGGVHTNSGVNNKAAYLMTDGGSFNGQTITGLGITKVAKIYYEVQTNLLTTAGDYQDLYDGLIQACSTLIGSGVVTAADCQQVQKAVTATEMNTQPTGCEAPEAPVCAVGQAPTNIFFDNLETPASGNWSSAPVSGSYNEWYYPQNSNLYGLDATYGTSGIYNFWGYDVETVADYAIAMNNNATLPAGTSYLHFRHAYGFEGAAYDGGVLEYSANGGAWTDAGGLFTENGYNGTISGSSNPLNGRSGFVSVSYGYTSSRLNLSTLAGQNVKFRFRIGTDSSGWDLGWFIDDIRIYTCQASVPTATRTPTPTRTATPFGWTPLPTQENFMPYVRKDKTPTPNPTPTLSPTPNPPPNTFNSVADSSVIQAYGGTNYGNYVDMLVGYDKSYFSPAYKAVRSMLAFDVSAIPAGTSISSATLNVYFVEWLDTAGSARTLKTYRITSGWTESGVTWSNQPSTNQDYGSATIVANSSWRYVAFDVTALVQAWVNGTYPNYGVMLRGPESGIWLRGFYTREGTYRPYLYVTYAGAQALDAPPAMVENPDAAQGPSFSDLMPGATDWETCLSQLTECFVHR